MSFRDFGRPTANPRRTSNVNTFGAPFLDVDEPREKTDLQFWVSRQQQLARERRLYHDRLAWRWLFGTFGLFAVSQTPPLWPSIHWTAFFGACIAGACAYANWNEARAASICAESWPEDH